MVGWFNACVKCSHLENALSYCILGSELRRSEQALTMLYWNKALWLDVPSHMNWLNVEGFLSVLLDNSL